MVNLDGGTRFIGLDPAHAAMAGERIPAERQEAKVPAERHLEVMSAGKTTLLVIR